MTKEEIREYEEEVVNQKVIDFFSSDYIYAKGQSRWGSFFEAHINALGGAPPAIIANWLLLDYLYPKDADSHVAIVWAIATWPVFFYLSVGRIYVFRRVFEHFGVSLEPVKLFKGFYHFIRYGKSL